MGSGGSSPDGVVPYVFMPSKDAIHFTTNLRPEHHEKLMRLVEAAQREDPTFTRNGMIRQLIESAPEPSH